MTYSLDTLQKSSSKISAPSAGHKFAHEIALLLGAVALLFWLLSMLSYSQADAAWSTSGSASSLSQATINWGGKLGARLADASYYVLGFSVWWCVLAALLAWLSSLARWLRGGQRPEPAHSGWHLSPRALFWLGLVVLLLASCTLEWTRLYRFEARLPGHAGGVLGYAVGSFAGKWLGFTGSGLVGIGLVVVGSAWAFGFSWARWADGIGSWVVSLWEQSREKREMAQDKAMGSQAAREREADVTTERAESEELHPAPIMMPPAAPRRQQVEPTLVDVLVDVPQSTRVAKERQKPLFSEMPDSKLPQVDLLDGAQLRQETVAPETLEMTSRMIEKKLKDFGVEVRVVAALPVAGSIS